MDLDTSVARLPTVSQKVVEGLARLGIKKVRHLLYYFPNRHEDRRKITAVSEVVPGNPVVLHGVLENVAAKPSFRRAKDGKARRIILTKAIFRDTTGELPVVWFYQRFIERQYPSGTEVYLCGTPSQNENGLSLAAPEIERATDGKEPVHVGRLTPVYSETEGVTSRYLRYLVSRCLTLSDSLVEYLPGETIRDNNLRSFKEAIRGIHFPKSEEELFESRRRLAFDELFILQLAALVRKKERIQEKSFSLDFQDQEFEKIVAGLPFSLTPSQGEAIKEIVSDLKKDIPMNRLLAGDVGSGKTVVAGLSAMVAALAGTQTALVAPTEILAQQHASSLDSMFKEAGLRVALLTGSLKTKEKSEIIKMTEGGEATLLVGTHALFHSKINFRKLGLIIVDEQHRFGVEQRAELTKKGKERVPHFLSLTATPIPRTLQLTAYGDVDVTMLEPRPGQKKVRTEVIAPAWRHRIYDNLAERMKKGEQVFVICPRVEETDDETKSVRSEFENLKKNIFPDFRVEMLHGKMESDEKSEILENFRTGEINLLVSSSVVEVGVDIPNATALLVEGAERFGLAQLHQFRGRVGRRGQSAVCYLASSTDEENALDRLRVMERTNDGLKIAEDDLLRRGAGEIYGTRQSGGVRLKVANITDVPFLLSVRAAAQTLLRRDEQLESCPILAKRVKQLNVTTHFE